MLVLSRKVGERIQIGDNITIVVNRVIGNRVTIGIEAPTDVRIVRSELAPLPAEAATPATLPLGSFGFNSDYSGSFAPRCAR